jgi:NADPH:quinone reductase-like Zn-dependent oxidoreductase
VKAVWFEKFGSAAESLQLGQLADPIPAAGEVLVALHSSGVNPSDVKKRAGAFPDLLDGGLVIPNSDGAGIITAVGEGVSESRIGERVWVYQAQYGRRFGTLAEKVCVSSNRAPALPNEVSFEVGACLGIPVMTAHRCVFADGPVEGQTILVTGGAGRVGYYAVQWAAQAGARVIATASTDADREACLAVGAQAVVNHRAEDWAAAVLAANDGQPVDRVIDVEFGANLETVLNVIRTGGVIATYSSTVVPQPQLPFVRMMFMDLTIRMVIVYAMPESAKEQAIADIDQALRAGLLTHRVAHVLPLAESARANELIEQGGFRGCVLVDVTA